MNSRSESQRRRQDLKPPPVTASTSDHPDRPQVSDAAWLALEPMLQSRGRHVRDVRQVFEGIAYEHRADVPWREIPTVFGPWQTLYAKYARWREDGTWTKLTSAT
ncbi:transposase [Actinophytocola algeriensis]|nr:transposase [Actinophytocola algeriensis]